MATSPTPPSDPPPDAESAVHADAESSAPPAADASVRGFASLFGQDVDESGYKPGDDIGPYRLLDKLGEGSFGVVFRAERRDPPVQRVAIKVIRPGQDSREVISRFKLERQVLAMMSHPGIAQIYDAGTAPNGRPFFVMQYVQGEPITAYCDHNRLKIEDRLRLFVSVCRAVQHAHGRGVIHRDLKPANILVSIVDNEPVPTIIDFGVAKALTNVATLERSATQVESVIGTLAYMSPEQAGTRPTDIDIRSDVFSLGVVLYELITGTVPLDSPAFFTDPFGEGKTIVRSTDRPRPSTRLGQLAVEERAQAEAAAKARQMELDGLRRHLRRELDWIPLKALRLDRTERYRSADELGDDVENYLAHNPLIAGPPGLWYKTRKFVRKHRVGVAAAIAVSAALMIGAGLAAWNWRVAVVERRATDDLLWFVNTAVVAGGSGDQPGGRIPVSRGAIDSAAGEARRTFGRTPRVLHRLNSTFANAYLAAGEIRSAFDLFKDTRLESLHGRELALAATVKGQALLRQRKAEQAIQTLGDALRRLDPSSSSTLSTQERAALHEQLAGALKFDGRFAEARKEYATAIELYKEEAAPQRAKLIELEYDLILNDVREVQGADKPKTRDDALRARYEAPLVRMVSLQEQARAELPEGHELHHSVAIEATALKYRRTRAPGDLAAFADAVTGVKEELGSSHFRVVEATARLAKFHLDEGQPKLAIQYLVRTLPRYVRVYGPDSPDTLVVAMYLARAQHETNDTAEALSTLDSAFAAAENAKATKRDLADRGEMAVSLLSGWRDYLLERQPDDPSVTLLTSAIAAWTARVGAWRVLSTQE